MAEKIKITMLGTGSAIPTPKRNHPAVLLTYKSENILIDCGEGTQTQFRKAKLNPCKITKILITHWHADHVLGIPGLLQTLMLNGYNKTLEVYGPKGTKKMMQLYIGLFAHKGDKFPIKVYENSSATIINTKEFLIQSKAMKHDTPTNAYSFVLKQKTRINKQKLKKLNLPNSSLIAELIKGKSITIANKKINPKQLIYTEPQKKITIIMDTLQNPSAINLAKQSDLLIAESTYSQEEAELAKQHKHLTSAQAANIAKKSKSKKLILTHLSQRYETQDQQKQILTQAKKIFSNTTIAEDLDKLEI